MIGHFLACTFCITTTRSGRKRIFWAEKEGMRFTKTIKVYSLAILFLMAGSVGSAFAQENEKANEIGLLLIGVSTSSRDL
jgi:hypothetical protein